MVNDNLKKPRFFIKVFGCQYNEWDAVDLANKLFAQGWTETSLTESDTVILLNCSVRKSGVDRALGFARNLNHKKVYVSGCVLDPDKKRFAQKGVELLNIEKLESVEASTDSKISKFIPIMKGCNNFCSYCVVPYTRGREISRPLIEILAEAKKVIDSGQKEIWLLGQNVNSYEFGFSRLLESLNNLPGNFQIYFTSNHPKDMSDEIIKSIKSLPKVTKIIHLPVQSGSDSVLRSMDRPYTRDQYLGLVNKIKSEIPNIKITTDFIVGYPTETEADFNYSVSLTKEVGFSQAYINKYSPREGTKSFSLGDPISWNEKERRWRLLNNLINKQID